MAQLAIAAAGAAVGSVFGPMGTQIGWAVGSMIGAQFGPKQKSHGPRLEDLRVTGSEYGQTVPWIAGHPRLAGQVWWASQRREIATTTSQGKGGGGAESTSYSYEVDILIGLTDTVIVDVSRIWLNGKLVYVSLATADVESIENSVDNPNWDRLTVYTGAAGQLPDPTYEAAVTNAPAYRGRSSVFIEGLQLGSSGVIPNLTFEIATGNAPANSTILLNGTFEERLVDSSCYDRGDATMSGAPPLGAFSDNGYTFTQDGDSAPSDIRAFGWSFAMDMQTAVDTTIELLFSVGASTGAPNTGLFVFEVGRNISMSNTAYSVYMDPFAATLFVRESFYGDSPTQSGVSRGAVHHVAIVIPASVSAGDPVRFYLNGTQIWTRSSKAILSDLIDTISLGGVTGITPPTTTHSVTYKGVRVTRDIVYPSGTSFTPPEEFPPLICIPATSLDNSTIRETVGALCERAMPAGSYDASALDDITKPVRAYAVAQVSTTRSAIEQLMPAYFFEAYVTDKLYFVPRAGSVLDTIDADDMGTGLESPEDETLPTQVGSDLEIPAQVSVSYSNVDADYTTATEHSDRLLSGQVSTSVVQLPLGFTAAEGKGIADAIVIDGYASRVTGTFSVPLKYAELTPTDVVAVPDADGNVYRVRIVRRTDEGPLLKFEWVLDDATAIESAGITSDDYTPTVDVALPGDTIMELLDIPLMRDAENTLGHYVAASSSGTTWPGASISRSLDDVEYAEAARVSERAILGVTTTTLGNFTGVGFDERNTVTVSLSYGTLSSSTRPGLLADASINNIMIGAELIRFRTATMLNQGLYILSGLLRGQNGTEWAMAGHTSSEVAVLIQAAGIRYVAIDLPSLSAERFYKGVTLGKSLASVSGEAFTCEGVSLKPLAPVDVRKSGSASTGLTLTWKRRTRLSSTFTGPSGSNVPLGEATEAYEVDLLNGSSVVVSTTAVTAATTTLSSAIESGYLPVGVAYIVSYGGDTFGVTTEGAAYAWKFLVQQTSAGAEVARLYVGGIVDYAFAVGGIYYAKIQDVNNSSTPAFTTKNAVYRIDMADIGAGFTHEYECGDLGDYGQIAFDGTYIWASEPASENLMKLNAATLAVEATHSMPGVAPQALAFDTTSGDLFFGDSTGYVHELIRWNIAGTSETWRVACTAQISYIGVRGTLVFATCNDGVLRVFSVSTGSLVASFSGSVGGPQTFPLLGSDVLTYLQVPTLGLCVQTFNTTTGALVKQVKPAYSGILGGVVGSDIWISYAVGDFSNYDARAYQLGSDFTGYTAKVYQISATVGRGYAASLSL